MNELMRAAYENGQAVGFVYGAFLVFVLVVALTIARRLRGGLGEDDE